MFDYFLKPEVLTRSRGNIDKEAIICPQAFGRNTWTDEEVSQKLQALFQKGLSAEQKLNDLARFKRLDSVDFDPGKVNHQLAETCYRLSYEEGNTLPQFIIGQWEVLYAVYKIDPKWYELFWSFHQAIWPPEDGSYLTTRGLLKSISKKIPSYKGVIVVGQAVHLARCARLADKIFGKERIIVPRPPIPLYDPQSVQSWTQNQESFLGWETKARIFEELPGFLRGIIRKFIQK
jgi:hypothetical protein